MRINIGCFQLIINRRVTEKHAKLSLLDVKSLNSDMLDSLRSVRIDELHGRVSQVSFRGLDDVSAVRRSIDAFGIAVFPNLFSIDLVQIAETVIEKIAVEIEVFKVSNDLVKESKHLLLQKGAAKLSSYNDLANYDKTVVQIREGQDSGMIDVFNIDIAYPELSELRNAYEESNILKILSQSSEGMELRNLNFYLNDSITSTRGFHADSYASQLKAFVYLTDCLTLENGPYTYVKGSHKDGPYRRFNSAASENLPNSTEAPFVRQEDIIPVLAGKGALIISDQSGFHRGFPQGKGHSRALAVINIK